MGLAYNNDSFLSKMIIFSGKVTLGMFRTRHMGLALGIFLKCVLFLSSKWRISNLKKQIITDVIEFTQVPRFSSIRQLLRNWFNMYTWAGGGYKCQPIYSRSHRTSLRNWFEFVGRLSFPNLGGMSTSDLIVLWQGLYEIPYIWKCAKFSPQ